MLRSHIDPAFGTRSLADIKEPHVYVLADAVGGRYRALVLLAVFGSLRRGELAALRRCDIDIHARPVRIFRQLSEQRGGGFAFGSPKSDAGRRVVAIPEATTGLCSSVPKRLR